MASTVSELVSAINALTNEKSPAKVSAHVRAIIRGVEEVGGKLDALEARIQQLEARLDKRSSD